MYEYTYKMKNRIKRILCPIDFSDAANNAMEYAAQLAQELNASLTLWNMREIPIMDEIATRSILPIALKKKEQELTEILKDWCEEIKNEYGIPCGYSIGTGIDNLEKTLAHYIDGENFDLIIAGTNGVDDMYQFFFGTNSYRIMKNVQCPVMVIPGDYSFKKINAVVFATDYTSADANIARDLVNSFHPDVTFVHFDKNSSSSNDTAFQSFKRIFQEKLYDENSSFKYKLINSEDKLNGLVELLTAEETDLVILSTEYRNWIDDLFHNSFTKKVLGGIQIPAMVFHQAKE